MIRTQSIQFFYRLCEIFAKFENVLKLINFENITFPKIAETLICTKNLVSFAPTISSSIILDIRIRVNIIS